LPEGLPLLPGARAAGAGQAGVEQPGGVRVPGRVDPAVAGPGGARRVALASRVAAGGLAQPDRRDRGAAPSHALRRLPTPEQGAPVGCFSLSRAPLLGAL